MIVIMFLNDRPNSSTAISWLAILPNISDPASSKATGNNDYSTAVAFFTTNIADNYGSYTELYMHCVSFVNKI